MNTYMNRWTVSLAWAVVMLIVWSLFVPGSISVTTFFLLTATGLVASMFGTPFFKEGQQPQSVGAIIAELESRPTADPNAGSDGRRR